MQFREEDHGNEPRTTAVPLRPPRRSHSHVGGGLATSAAADQDASPDVSNTATPIKHLVVVVGENRSFDHIYGLCHGNSIEHAVRAETRHASCRCDGTSPLCGSFCSKIRNVDREMRWRCRLKVL